MTSRTPSQPSNATPSDSRSNETDGERSGAKDELFEAIEHLKNAASILFEKASKDRAVRAAKDEAERVIQKLGATAEPLAKQLTNEVTRLTRTIVETVEGRRKSEVPPPPADDGN